MMNSEIQDVVERDGYRWEMQSCPICERRPTRFVGKRGGRSHRAGLGVEAEIWKCVDCGLVFPDPMPIPISGLAQHYGVAADEYFEHHKSEGKDAAATALVEKAEQLLGRKGRLLDVGVGRGEVLLAAAAAGWESEGVEPSQAFADHAERRTEAKIWRQPVEESPIEDSAYDVIVLAAVLEHLYDPNSVVERISRALKPAGLLYLDVPNEAGLYFKVANAYERVRGNGWTVNLAPTFSPFHVFGFSPKALKKLLAKHGMRSREWNVYGGTSLLPNRGGFIGTAELSVAKLITYISRFGGMGTYIETWAEKL